MGKSISEIDGLPREFVYKSVAFIGLNKAKVIEALDRVIAEAKNLLPDHGIIIWRDRPLYDQFKGGCCLDDGKYYSYCRFETSPPLPDKFWKQNIRLEGEPYKEVA